MPIDREQFKNRCAFHDDLLEITDLGGHLWNAQETGSEAARLIRDESDGSSANLETAATNVDRLGTIAKKLHTPAMGLMVILGNPDTRKRYEALLAEALRVELPKADYYVRDSATFTMALNAVQNMANTYTDKLTVAFHNSDMAFTFRLSLTGMGLEVSHDNVDFATVVTVRRVKK
jgi:hypothetical protein